MSEFSSYRRRRWAPWLLLAILLVGAYFRASGLFRGLARGAVFHPDAPKQVLMLSHYLQGRHVQYHDCLFYDGYPYGLNRVDDLLIRPLYGAVHGMGRWLAPDAPPDPVPSRSSLYRWARVLRVLYGLAAVGLL